MNPSAAVLPPRPACRPQGPQDIISDWCPLATNIVEAEYSVQVATTIHEIEALRPTWRKWAHSLDNDIDYYLYNLSHDSTSLRPYVVTVHHDGVVRAILVGQIRRQRASTIVSFINVPGPVVRVLEIKKGGRMGQPSQAIDRLLALELLRATKIGEVDSICFERLPLHSGLFREIRQLPGLRVKQRIPHIFCYCVLPLTAPEGNGPRVFSGKTRRENRRKERILERAFPGQVTVKCFSQLDELDAGMCDVMRVAVTTWQFYLGLGLTDNAQTRETFRFCIKQGWLRTYVLYIDNTPCAFLVGQLYNNTFYCQYAGYHPNFKRFSVGCLLTARAFEDLAAAGVHRVDLSEGGQEHHRRLGCQMSEEGTVHLYSPTLSGAFLNLFFGTTQVIRKGGRRTRLALHLGSLGNIWRRFLLSKGQAV